MTETVRLTVNGTARDVAPRPGLSLLRYLRNDLGLTGARQGCETGLCGACTVLCDGAAVQSCQMTVAAADGLAVETVEALVATPDGAAIAEALIREQAAQCGYCLPGIVASAVAVRRADGASLIDALSRHICRCGTHHRILRALEAQGGASDG